MTARDPKSLIRIARAQGSDELAAPLDLGARVRELRKERSWTLEQAAQKAVNVYQSRGTLHSIRLGEKTFITGSFSAMLADVSDSSAGNLLDFIRKSNAYSSNASTLGSGDAYLIKITLEIEGTDLGDSADHTIVLDDCACSADVSEGEPDSISISWTSYADPVMT